MRGYLVVCTRKHSHAIGLFGISLNVTIIDTQYMSVFNVCLSPRAHGCISRRVFALYVHEAPPRSVSKEPKSERPSQKHPRSPRVGSPVRPRRASVANVRTWAARAAFSSGLAGRVAAIVAEVKLVFTEGLWARSQAGRKRQRKKPHKQTPSRPKRRDCWRKAARYAPLRINPITSRTNLTIHKP
jgi:hypothetical protein